MGRSWAKETLNFESSRSKFTSPKTLSVRSLFDNVKLNSKPTAGLNLTIESLRSNRNYNENAYHSVSDKSLNVSVHLNQMAESAKNFIKSVSKLQKFCNLTTPEAEFAVKILEEDKRRLENHLEELVRIQFKKKKLY